MPGFRCQRLSPKRQTGVRRLVVRGIILGPERLGTVVSLTPKVRPGEHDWPLAMRMRIGRGNGGWHRLLTSKLVRAWPIVCYLPMLRIQDVKKKSKSKKVQKSKCPNARYLSKANIKCFNRFKTVFTTVLKPL